MTRREYWAECLSQAADDCGLKLTAEQLGCLAEAVEGADENIGMAFPTPPSPYPDQIRRLECELVAEREKRFCRECQGTGRVRHDIGLSHYSISECFKCRGKGKLAP